MRVFDAAGRCVGRVHDLRTRGGAGADACDVVSLACAGPGLLERLGLGRGRRDRVAWDRVRCIDAAGLRLQDGTPPS